jgi:heterodisulfide reductase subunit A-like polyferredoxin/coenzyme F420-reducing hydrogenase delta subunit
MEFGNIGVFLCSCGKTLNLDFKKIANELDKLDEVTVVERVERLCTEEGLAYIVDDLRRKDLDKIVVAACSNKNEVFENLGQEMGLDPLGVDIVNIREDCAWVHSDKKSATQKAKFLVRNAVKREIRLPEVIEVEVKPSILIAGDTSALDLAEDFDDFDVELHVLNEEPYFKRDPISSNTYKPSNKGSIYEFQDANLHTNSKILDITGDLGDFAIDVEKGRHIDIVKCVDCGLCLEACEQKAVSRPPDSTTSVYVIGEKCNECGECVKVCPTNAITLDAETETLNVGQIISFYPQKPREGVYCIDSKSDGSAAHDAALQAALNIKGYKKEKFIESDLEKCANHRLLEKKLDLKGCTYCEDACAYFPVSSGTVSNLACKGCGSCATSCPQDTYKLKFQSFDELIKDVTDTSEADIKQKIIMFACMEGGYSTVKAAGMNRLEYPPVLPIYVPCLGNVSESHILRAFDVGAEGVVLLGCGSEKCMYEKGFSRGSTSVGLAKKILGFFGVENERVRMLNSDGTDPKKFVKQMLGFEERLRGLGKNPLTKGKPADLESIDEKGNIKREMFHALIAGFAEKAGISEGKIEGDLPVGYLKVDEKECTLCGSCTYHCNTGALRYEGKEIIDIFNTHTYCIACGICEGICPENAITLEKVIEVGSFVDKKENKFDIKIINCSRCGRPLMAEAALKKLSTRLKEKELDLLQLCQSCLDKDTVSDLTGAKPDEIVLQQQGKAPWE